MKIGIIRCMQTENYCPATTDIKYAKEKKGVFEGTEGDIEIIGINSCGGCPGKKAPLRGKEMVDRGADTIVFASCISKGNPIGFACPFAKKIREAVSEYVGEEVKILDYTH